MAVHTLGAPSPASSSAVQPAALRAAARPLLQLVPQATSRKRCNHGTFMLGGQLAGVYSARSAGKCYGIRFELGTSTLSVDADMTAGQARSMARALLAAAAAVDRLQAGAVQLDDVEGLHCGISEVCEGAGSGAAVQEGGAA